MSEDDQDSKLSHSELFRSSKTERISWSKFLFDRFLHCESNLDLSLTVSFTISFMLPRPMGLKKKFN